MATYRRKVVECSVYDIRETLAEYDDTEWRVVGFVAQLHRTFVTIILESFY